MSFRHQNRPPGHDVLGLEAAGVCAATAARRIFGRAISERWRGECTIRLGLVPLPTCPAVEKIRLN